MAKLGDKVLANFIWRFMERIGAQLVSVIVSIVLARILATTDYGTVALMNVFINILAVFINGGFSNALIQKKNADDLDFSSVFYSQLFLCISLYVILFLCAPWIATFYGIPEISSMIRVLGLTLIISGVKNIQIAYVSKHMMFKKFFFATLGGTIGAAFLGIYLALAGYGAWALIVQSLFNHIVDTIILWITVKWRPKRVFSFERLKKLFSYGWKLLFSALLDVGYNELRSLLIGKVYSSNDLAFYEKGRNWPNLIVNNVNSSIDSVLLPAMSSEQDDKKRIKEMTRRAIKTSTFLMMPIMMGLAVCAETIVKIVLTDKWLSCVFFMRIFCFSYAFYPIHTANLNAIKAIGRSDLFLRLEIVKKMIGLIALLSTMFISVKAMAISLLFTSFLCQMVNAWPNRKLIDYRYEEQFMDMFPQILISCFMGAVVYSINFLNLNSYFTILIQIPLGVMVYLLPSKIFGIESYQYIIGLAKKYVSKKKGREI